MNRSYAVGSSIKFLWLIGISFALLSCSSSENKSVKDKNQFHFAILDTTKLNQKSTTTNEWEKLWPILKQAYPSSVLHDIDEVAIERYDWTKQRITLTPEASDMLFKSLACSTDDRRDDLYPTCLLEHRFVIALGDIPIYGGIFIFEGSQRSIHYPIMYPSFVNGKVIFTILSSHPAGISTEPGWDTIKDERIKTIFSHLGKLTE